MSGTSSNGNNTTDTSWPQQWIGDNGQMVDTSIPGLYRREAGIWVDGYLQQVPEFYRTLAGNVCSGAGGGGGGGGTSVDGDDNGTNTADAGATTPPSSTSSGSTIPPTLAPSLPSWAVTNSGIIISFLLSMVVIAWHSQ
jgi:hypothetical protein